MNKKRFMKKIIVIIWVLMPVFIYSQSKTITLAEAISIAQKKSPDYKTTLNKNQSFFWRFKNYKARFLPQLKLSATLPEFSKATKRITNDDGEDIFTNQNQLRLDGGLSISQNVSLTGGTFSVFTNFQRIEIFGDNQNTYYSIIPFSLGYQQNSLFYNAFKWDKKIEPLIFEESKREYIEDKLSEKPTRSIVKSISWRIIGTIDTILISWLVTGEATVAFSIGSIELLTKMLLYFFHERIWNTIKWGKK